MIANYWTVKYVEDTFRNEPRNVGVIVCKNGVYSAKFIGERMDSTIDGRRLRGFKYPSVYTQWITFWRKKLLRRDIAAIVNGNASNFYVEEAGEVTETGSDGASEVCDFLYNLVVEKGPVEAFDWLEIDDPSIALEADIAAAFSSSEILSSGSNLLTPHPVMRNEAVPGRNVTHTPSFSQLNGKRYVMDYLDFSSRKELKTKERAGYMAFMFNDIQDFDENAVSYSIVRLEADDHAGQIEYATKVLGSASTIVNWIDERAKSQFLAERRVVALSGDGSHQTGLPSLN